MRSFAIATLIFGLFLCHTAADEPESVDPSTLDGKVMCGYQGWFAAEGDDSHLGWQHYSGRGFEPGKCSIDYWPDMREMDDDEKYATPFRHADGSAAHVFSSSNPKTVDRHFQWMKGYGIDGVFLQRFAGSTKSSTRRRHNDLVMANVRASAEKHGRAWALMYDLSGLREGDIDRVLIEDFKRIVDERNIFDDPTYLHHKGRPVVAVWGVGFNDGRRYTLEECGKLVSFLKDDPKYGGVTVMLGVPTGWRELTRDAVRDPMLHEVIAKADIVSPWTVGRYRTPREAMRHAEHYIAQDVAWCKERGLDFLPVAFPGFSWHNLDKSRGVDSPLDQIPRLGGEFLWTQAVADRRAGAKMLYIAMFDEMDEGTAIFKCTNDPPVGESPFLTYKGLPTDHYLWLVGRITEMFRSESKPEFEIPTRE